MYEDFEDLVERLGKCTAEQNGEKTLWCQAADAIDDLLYICKHQATEIRELKNQWIPVAERLPEGRTNVLCCGANGGMFVGWTSGYVFKGKVRAFVHGGSGRNITHWMPLPEAPKDGE